MNPKKSPIHENADANITCDFGDGDISRLGVAYLTHAIHTYLDYINIYGWLDRSDCMCFHDPMIEHTTI